MKKIGSSAESETLAGRLLQRLPVDTAELGSRVRTQAQKLERRVLKTLKERMDQIETAAPSVSVVAFSMRPDTAHHKVRTPKQLGERMRELLNASTEHSRDDAQTEFFSWVVDNLVPDQARILSAMSDGSSYPLLHVLAGKKIGIATEPVLECICSVGKNAGILWPDTTHVHVQQLRNWGLVEIGPEDMNREVQYEMLETESLVRKTVSRLQSGGLRVQIVRRVLRISELGNELWAATRISDD